MMIIASQNAPECTVLKDGGRYSLNPNKLCQTFGILAQSLINIYWTPQMLDMLMKKLYVWDRSKYNNFEVQIKHLINTIQDATICKDRLKEPIVRSELIQTIKA